MTNLRLTFSLLILTCSLMEVAFGQDWANLNRYEKENAALGLPALGEERVVFMGNSITEGWGNMFPAFFVGRPYINRGIGGQTTPQMLIRFRADVINLKPSIVIILAGTNDIAGNTGPSTIEMIAGNIMSMAELAQTNDIKVIVCSVLPVFDYPWKPGLDPAEKIIKLNKILKVYAEENGMMYLDYFKSMVDERNGLKAELASDGVHPTIAGYQIMGPLAEEAIAKALIKN